jgi:hypothetical protein
MDNLVDNAPHVLLAAAQCDKSPDANSSQLKQDQEDRP